MLLVTETTRRYEIGTPEFHDMTYQNRSDDVKRADLEDNKDLPRIVAPTQRNYVRIEKDRRRAADYWRRATDAMKRRAERASPGLREAQSKGRRRD